VNTTAATPGAETSTPPAGAITEVKPIDTKIADKKLADEKAAAEVKAAAEKKGG